ncbi:unnamed protein product [Amoebophrya sp. A120]|nr:unnamed protein product [Amoebophrya sp. A120]|eukprot:GSA120T00001374001.1
MLGKPEMIEMEQKAPAADVENQLAVAEKPADQCFVKEWMAEGEHAMAEGKSSKPLWCKIPLWFIGSILTLVGLAVSLVFLVVWVLLMPIKCCMPGGSIVSILECLMNQGVKLPLRIAKCFF